MFIHVEARRADQGMPGLAKLGGHRQKTGAALLGAFILGTTATASISGAANAQEVEKSRESPLSFRIGGTDFTPGGFIDFENVFRTSATGFSSRYPSAYPSPNPFVAFKINQAWGRWDCATNAANPQACADPFTTSAGTNRLRLYWLDLKRGKWEFVTGQPWSVSGSLSAGLGGVVSNTQITTPFSTLRTHANGAMFNLNGVLNTPFLSINGTVNLVPAPLLDGPGTFSETFLGFTDYGRLTSSRIAGGTVDVGVKPLSWVVPPVASASVFTGAIISPFAGYSIFNESLRGSLPGTVEFPVNSQNWQSVRIGAKAEAPLNLNFINSLYNPTLTFSGAFNPWVQTQTGNFTANGTGFQLEGSLSFPLNTFMAVPTPTLNGTNLDLFAKYSYMRATGDTGGAFPIPVESRNENLTLAATLKILFGDTTVPAR